MLAPKNLLLASLTLALSTTLASAQTLPTAAEDTPAADAAAKGSARDQAAVDDALHGWWTSALATRDQRLDWWRDARFGCFMHWGVYSELGGIYQGKRSGSYSEHIMRVLKIPRQEYFTNVVTPFDPEKFDATAWVHLLKDAGMKYLVITSKHHDGFAMYPSEVTTYNLHDATKFKRDPMQELSDACHAATASASASTIRTPSIGKTRTPRATTGITRTPAAIANSSAAPTGTTSTPNNSHASKNTSTAKPSPNSSSSSKNTTPTSSGSTRPPSSRRPNRSASSKPCAPPIPPSSSTAAPRVTAITTSATTSTPPTTPPKSATNRRRLGSHPHRQQFLRLQQLGQQLQNP